MARQPGQSEDRPVRWRRAAMLLAVTAVVAAAVVLLMARTEMPAWARAAVSSRPFVYCAALTAGCLVVLVLLSAGLVRLGAARRRVRRGAAAGQDGTAIAEFALVLVIALPLVMVMIQSTLVMAGNLCVHYAAYCAARSAIVQIPDDLGDDEPPNVLLTDQGSQKMRRIRLAAIWAVLGVSAASPNVPGAGGDTLGASLSRFYGAYGQSPPFNISSLSRRLAYAEQYTDVEVSPPADGMMYRENEDIRASVSHVLYLSVPYTSWVFRLMGGSDFVNLDFGDGECGMVIRAHCTLTNEGVTDYVPAEEPPDEE